MTSVDIGNPAYKPSKEVQFDMDEFEDIIISSSQRDINATIKYEAYEYDGAVRIVKLEVDLDNVLPCFFDFLEDQITESIGLRINKYNIVLECKVEFK